MIEDDKNLRASDIDDAYDDEENVDIVDEAYDEEISDDNTPLEPLEEVDDSVADTKAKKTKKTKKSKTEKNTEPKVKKPLSKQNKIIIIVVAIILAIAILATAIAVPISISRRGKIFVSTAEDFENTDGKLYVLEDDVTVKGDLVLGNINNINLNGRTLTVEGTLKIESSSTEPVVLGVGKEKELGTLQAKSIVITSTSDVRINAITKSDSVNIVAPKTAIEQGVNLVSDSIIESQDISIKDDIVFADNTKSNLLTLSNATTIDIESNISGNISIKNTIVSEEPIVTRANIIGIIKGNVLGDERANITIDNKVTGVVDTNKAIITGDGTVTVLAKLGKVTLGANSFVKSVNNATYVLVHTDAIYPNMVGVDKIDIIRRLESVAYIDIDNVADKMIMTFASVQGADAYIVRIDKLEPIEVTETTLDITDYVRNVDKHRISVQAISKTNSEVLQPSVPLICEHTTFLTLAKATGIVLNKVEDKWMLTWNAVNFADTYEVTVNGKPIKTHNSELDVTEYINGGGAYLFNIVARSNNANILESKPAMYKSDIIVSLSDVTLDINSTIEDKYFHMTLTWNKVDNAKYYEVILLETAGEETHETILYRTTSNTFEATQGTDIGGHSVKRGDKFVVRAVTGSQYYTNVTSNTVVFDI